MSDDEGYAFDLRLLIKHPALTRESITAHMNMQPMHGWSVGMPRRTPSATLLGGFYDETYWGYSERIKGRRDFFRCAVEFARTLEPQQNLASSHKEGRRSGHTRDNFLRVGREKGLLPYSKG
ncbi:hypothetical protein [Paraburkholderia sp. DHOC27]|uniref:hypothetical protein n=1 Tax=Paraburkholderia sp. DHOC27 TaxID=2303330 RepID=UPI0015F34101|nr:hypothetical protein [Paraburkholderia sp. DHOC27]